MNDRSLFRYHKVIQREPSRGEILEREALIAKMKKREEDFAARNPGVKMPVDTFKSKAEYSERRALDKRLREFMSDPSA